VPCDGTNAGTALEGINNNGDLSGHFYDTSNNVHGFIWLNEGGQFTANGFIQIDVPGAYQTSGGGLNDFTEIVGHYNDSSCNYFGYAAQPEAGYTAQLQ
jgi:hypothetical protein